MKTLKFWISELINGDTTEARQRLKKDYNIAEEKIEAILSGRRHNLDTSHIREG